MRELTLPEVDVVVAIARGGIVPAAMIAHQMGVPLELLRVNYRDDNNKPCRTSPELLEPLRFDPSGLRVLLVDDVSVSGATLARAREALFGATITTLVCKGRADLVLFPQIRECVEWPWRVK
jgi:hypoxanthine phosphoribosyltransferase